MGPSEISGPVEYSTRSGENGEYTKNCEKNRKSAKISKINQILKVDISVSFGDILAFETVLESRECIFFDNKNFRDLKNFWTRRIFYKIWENGENTKKGENIEN